jgi:vancomycin resistance protein YoaR
MPTSPHTRTLFPVFFISIVVLIGSFVVLSGTQYYTKKIILPETIILHNRELMFSTPSASLVSSEKQMLDKKQVAAWVASISAQLSIPSVPPRVEYDKKTKKVNIFAGTHGQTIDEQAVIADLLSQDWEATNSATFSVHETGSVLTPDATITSEKRAATYLGKQVTLQTGHYKKILKDTELLSLLELPSGYSQDGMHVLAQLVDKDIATPPTEPILQIDGNTVTEFVAPKDGIGLNTTVFIDELSQTLEQLAAGQKIGPVEISLIKTSPTSSLAEVNTLGIEEQIGRGTSSYLHSIPNRVHNVSLTTKRIHATLVAPGETFSFNKALGDVSAASGFKQAYVIKQGQTVLGDGGGVCQVSSTLFRALLNSGMPITARRGHSYRVGYYEQNSKPGFDATVYDPNPDLRFLNDTGHTILINAVADPKTLSMYIELWGKSDGRKAEVLNYRQWDAVAAPPPVYQDDPTLKPGEVKQIDYAAPGLKTSFNYIVTYPDGQKKEQTFNTTYTPWAAVYLRGF